MLCTVGGKLLLILVTTMVRNGGGHHVKLLGMDVVVVSKMTTTFNLCNKLKFGSTAYKYDKF